jgi:hypothetical protein
MKIILFFCAMLFYGPSFGQAVYLSSAQVYSYSNAISPVKNMNGKLLNTETTITFGYEHFLKKKRLSVFANFIRYNACTFVHFEPGGVVAGGGEILAKGFCGGTIIKKIDSGVSFSPIRPRKRFFFRPSIGVGLQWTKNTGVEYWGDGLPINGPSYFELEPMRSETIKSTQIVPNIGLRTGFLFWNRFDVSIGVNACYAFFPIQKLHLKYEYKGDRQPDAEYETTGTGMFTTLSVGYRFAKLIQQE